MTAPSLRYRGVMFDLGGTLFDDLPAYRVGAVQRKVLTEAGIRTEGLDALESTFRQARRDVEAELRRQPGYLHRDLVTRHFLAGVERLGLMERLADPAAWATRYADLMRSVVTSELRLKRGCHEVLAALADSGCDLTVVSNNDEGYLQTLIHKWGLHRRLRCWLSSDRAGLCKPDPGIFALGLGDSDLSLSEVLYVGDSIADDVAGARAAGMDVALLGSGQVAGDHAATYCISVLEELVDIVTD